MFTAKFWRATFERAAKTFVQAFGVAAALGEPGASVFALDWQGSAGIGLAAALASLVTSIVSAPMSGDPDSPSLVAGEK
jgi:hypothetical protein